MVALVSQAKARLTLLTAVAGVLLIWSLWVMGVRMNPFSAHLVTPHPTYDRPATPGRTSAERINSSPVTRAPAEFVLSPLPTASPTPPKFPPFETFVDHMHDSSFVSPRPLVLYAFFDTEAARRNLMFFLEHGLHDEVDILFVLNGETDAESLLPRAGNIRYVKRSNECYDLGAFAEVLTTNDLYTKYKKYILMNSSLRGPFVPYWSDNCWSERYLSKLTDKIKLVGLSMNCAPRVHLQSMILATDRIGLEILLFPSKSLTKKFRDAIGDAVYLPVPKMAHPGINSCPVGYWDAVSMEVHSTGLLQTAGYQVDTMMMAYHKEKDYQQHCGGWGDVQGPHQYFGINLHPYDTMFTKTNRHLDELTIKLYTEWVDGAGYKSYESCKKAYAKLEE